MTTHTHVYACLLYSPPLPLCNTALSLRPQSASRKGEEQVGKCSGGSEWWLNQVDFKHQMSSKIMCFAKKTNKVLMKASNLFSPFTTVWTAC